MLNHKTVLVLAPHPDDEWGCAGTLYRLSQDGAEIHYAVFTDCSVSLPDGFTDDDLEDEMRDCLRLLGVQPGRVWIDGWPVRYLAAHRQAVLEWLVELRAQVEPDLVLCPSSTDKHQDHRVIYEEARRAFTCSLWGYDIPWNQRCFHADIFVRLDHDQITRKLSALNSYRSQKHRPYMAETKILAVAVARGLQAGCDYAESFENIRTVL